MTPHDLIAAFEALAEAPEGVARLRELILQLAVRGRLVPQDPKDEPATSLLHGARDALQQASRTERGCRWKALPQPTLRDLPFKLPSGWAYVRINDTGHYVNGMTFKPSQWTGKGLPIIRIQNLSDPSREFNYAECEADKSVLVRHGDILVSWSATLEAFIWQGGDALLNQHIFRVDACAELLDRRYLFWLLRQSIRDLAESDHAHGLVMTHINRGPFLSHVVGIPPMQEQHRIVARVEELMGLLDRLEAARTKREATRAAARDSVLAALREADSPEAVDAAWTRFAQRMDDLLCDPADIAPLRQAVLQLAVRGRLVRQDPKDESARQSLRAAQKASGLHPQESTEPPGADGFPTPSGWTWVAVGAAGRLRLGKMLDKAKNKGIPCPYLRNTNVHWFRFELDSIKEMPIENNEIDELLVSPGDLLICEGGHGIARSAVWRGELPRVVFQKALHRVRPLPCLNSDWLSYCLRVLESIGDLQRHYTGAGIPHFTGKALARVVVPLPPLAEQQHIVARVKELMGLLDRLEQRFAAVKQTHATFAGAAVHHVVA